VAMVAAIHRCWLMLKLLEVMVMVVIVDDDDDDCCCCCCSMLGGIDYAAGM
jgi:hypothetical protein